MKKMMSVLLMLVMCFALASPIFAYDTGVAGVGSTISCGGFTTAAIDTSGALWAWGDNRYGQLGNGGVGTGRYRNFGVEYTMQTVPTKIMENVASVSCGNSFTAAIKTDGSLWMWGDNRDGELGNGGGGNAADISGYPYWNTPVKVTDGVAAVSSGVGHTAIVKTDGTLWMCGSNFYGQLGNDGNGNSSDHRGFTIQTVPAKVMDHVMVSVAPTFTDVPSSAYYAKAVDWAVENGITTGTGGKTFSPGANVNRAQAVTFLWRTQGCPEPTTKANPFTDVKTDSWYFKAVLWAVENEITNGTGADTFSPDGSVTRGQMMAFLYRTMGEPGKTGTGAWYADAESWARQNNLLNDTAVAYSTNGDCPRSDVVYYLWKALAS